jgi:hypothetical protein
VDLSKGIITDDEVEVESEDTEKDLIVPDSEGKMKSILGGKWKLVLSISKRWASDLMEDRDLD